MNKKILFLSVAMIIGASFFARVQFSLAADPSVTVLSPTSGPSNASVTMYGSNFTSTGNQINFFCPAISSGGGEASVLSIDGKSLVTRVAALAVQAGTTVSYPLNCTVSITNVNGTSNLVPFTITSPFTQPSVTILSPNGGETWTKGTSQTIKWQDNSLVPTCPPGAYCALNISVAKFYDLKLAPYYPPCTGNICPAYAYREPYPIATRISGSLASYSWSVGKIVDSYGSGEIAPDGNYTVQVCQSGTETCDSSDSYFKIISVTSQPSVTILSPNGGEIYKNDGSSITVNWQTNNVPASHVIDIIRLRVYPSGREYNLATNVLNDGQEVISIPASVPVGAYTLEIKTYVGETLVMDSSDSYFKIVDVFQDQPPVTTPSATAEEQVKCVFKGATSEQKCYTATDNSSPYSSYGCSGTESCLVDMKGINGDKITWKSSCGGYAYSVMDGSNDYAIFDCASSGTTTTSTVSQTPIQQISDINEKSKLLSSDNFDFILAELDQLRSVVKEQQTQIKYLTSLLKDVKGMSVESQDAINNFITYGVDANTEKLGAGERAAVINSYKVAFDKLPQTEAELADAIKIANGRFPSVTSNEAEKTAQEQFVKIYKRAPDLNNANDNAAVKVMAYGLRQKAENRNLNSEKAGIKIFKNIFGSVPKTTEDWNTMQAITYSGATR